MQHQGKLLPDQLYNINLVVFDGECVLCSGFFNFIVKYDRDHAFYFATAQSDLGEKLYAHYELKSGDYDTNLVLLHGRLYERLHGFFAVVKVLGFPWNILNLFSLLPLSVLDWTYYKTARNRYRWFGKRESCLVPNAELQARFIDE